MAREMARTRSAGTDESAYAKASGCRRLVTLDLGLGEFDEARRQHLRYSSNSSRHDEEASACCF